jgi:hypothetical protein
MHAHLFLDQPGVARCAWASLGSAPAYSPTLGILRYPTFPLILFPINPLVEAKVSQSNTVSCFFTPLSWRWGLSMPNLDMHDSVTAGQVRQAGRSAVPTVVALRC